MFDRLYQVVVNFEVVANFFTMEDAKNYVENNNGDFDIMAVDNPLNPVKAFDMAPLG